MRTVNKVILIGNIAKDPLVRSTQWGAKNALFVVATNRLFKDRNGVAQNESEFTNCIAWGPLAERCEKFLTKWKLVYIEGRLKTRSTQKEDGTKIHRTEVVVANLIFLNKREDAPDHSEDSSSEESHAHVDDVPMDEILDDNTF